MAIFEKKLIKRAIVFLALINLMNFFVYYTAFYIFKNQATLYIFYYCNDIANTLLPVLSATVLFTLYPKYGVNKSLLFALYFSLTWILNLFPYYAYEYAYQRLDFGEVLFFAGIHTFFMLIVIYIEITVLFLLMIFVTEKIAKKKSGSFNTDYIFKKSKTTDFSNPVTIGIFSASFAMFVYNLVTEIIDTVSYLVDVWGYYESNEIIYIIFRYCFALGMLLISHFLSIFVRNKLLSDT